MRLGNPGLLIADYTTYERRV